MDIVEKTANQMMNIHKNLPMHDKYNDIFLALVFLKRLSDKFDEKKLDGIEKHDIFVPESASWTNLIKLKSGLEHRLINAFEALEENNDCLNGVLTSLDIPINNSKDSIFRAMQNLSFIDMSDNEYENKNQFAEIFDLLISRILETKSKGEYTTNQDITNLLSSLLDPKDNMTILDPFCRTGELLVQCAKYVEQKEGKVCLYGQEFNETVWRYCIYSFLVHNNTKAVIKKGDSILNPAFVNKDGLIQFDRLVSVPPFGRKEWGYEIAKNDEYSRFRYGIPPKSRGDLAYLQHMLACMKDDAKAIIVMPQGVLFRGGPEGEIRKNILKNDFLEAVIMLPTKMFQNTAIQTVIIIINLNKSIERKNSILFISADNMGEKRKRRVALNEVDITKIIETYRKYENIEKFCRVVSFDEIRDNEYSLNFSLYLDTYPEIETVDLKNTLQEIQNLQTKKKQLMDRIVKIMD